MLSINIFDLSWSPTGPGGLNPMVSQGLAPQDASGDQSQKVQAAMEVEAIFLGQLLDIMRRALVDSVGPPHQDLKGYLSLADQHLARSLAAGGGLGLASKILQDLAPLESSPQKENRHAGNLLEPGGTDSPGAHPTVSKAP